MRTRSSEYQTAYPNHGKEACINIHKEMITYRRLRREKENEHWKMQWDSSESGGSSPANELQEEKTESVNVCESDNLANDSLDSEHSENETNENSDIKNCEATQFKKLKSKTEVNTTVRLEKPPFYSYGWADKELDTARKWTHNVRADSRYVYPGALKKLEHIKNERVKQTVREESRASVASALLQKQKAQINDVWQTEYQRCYSRASSTPSLTKPSKRRCTTGSRIKLTTKKSKA